MNTHVWIQYFLSNQDRFVEPPMPPGASCLPGAIREPVARSLAIFQLGESGGGTRLMKIVRRVVPDHLLPGYERAVGLFVAEEQYHAAMLERLVRHLGGALLKKQWSNSVFRWVRNLFGVEFNIQVLLTAELIAEAYYGLLYRRCPDPAVRVCCRKILADEVRHLAFHAEFLSGRLAAKTAWGRRLWRAQCRALNLVTVAVVAWDHGACFRALGPGSLGFASLASRTGARFLRRLQSHATPPAARPAQAPATSA